MPIELAWRELGPSDTSKVQQWVCADPAKSIRVHGSFRKYHPRPWELEVQSFIRSGFWRKRGVVWAAVSENKILSLAHLWRQDDADATHINAIACAIEHRRKGLGTLTLHECIRLASGEDSRLRASAMTANIRSQNEPSKRLFAGQGFEHIEDEGDDLEVWARLL